MSWTRSWTSCGPRARVTYRVLKREFQLDDAFIEDLKEELIYGQQLAVDEDGRVLVWTGPTQDTTSTPIPAPASPQMHAPLVYTPQHLTEKILASRSALEGERKWVTVFFADIKDSTRLIEGSIPRRRSSS